MTVPKWFADGALCTYHYDDGSGDWEGYLRVDKKGRWIFVCPNEEAKKRGSKKWEEEILPEFYDMISLREPPSYEMQERKRKITSRFQDVEFATFGKVKGAEGSAKKKKVATTPKEKTPKEKNPKEKTPNEKTPKEKTPKKLAPKKATKTAKKVSSPSTMTSKSTAAPKQQNESQASTQQSESSSSSSAAASKEPKKPKPKKRKLEGKKSIVSQTKAIGGNAAASVQMIMKGATASAKLKSMKEKTAGASPFMPVKNAIPVALSTSVVPEDDPGRYLAINVGNTRTHWSLCESKKNKQVIAWHTPHLHESELYKQGEYNMAHVIKYLAVQNYQEDFERLNEMRIYVVSVVEAETRCIKDWFGRVGSKVYILKSTDFYNNGLEGGYETLGADRAANQFGSRNVKQSLAHDIPSLVVDCGTCITFTSSKDFGFGIRAGGILPGIQTSFNAMANSTSALPMIKISDEIKKIEKEKDKKIEMFGKGNKTKDAMIAGVICSACATVRDAIASWIDILKKEDNNTKHFQVFVTGGDATVVTKGIMAQNDTSFLATNGEGLVPSPLVYKDEGCIKLGDIGKGINVSIQHSKNIAFHGIRRLVNTSGEHLKGKRVARGGSYGTITGGGASEDTMWIWKCHISWDKSGGQHPEVVSIHAAERLVLENEQYQATYEGHPDSLNKAKGNKKYGGAPKPESDEPKAYTGLRIAKKFDGVVYLGSVKKYSHPYWEVVFDDEDKEEWEIWEFESAFQLYQRYVAKHGDEKEGIPPTSS
mmetsp:Transcript_12487/g.25495  ORF Transcript_12487/g.25495 Transcript_12487/m.25495 type:complete len:764 (+) Transcript_12487:38-2329(+)